MLVLNRGVSYRSKITLEVPAMIFYSSSPQSFVMLADVAVHPGVEISTMGTFI
jgi:hypothetical protein